MSSSEANPHSAKEMIDALKVVRDRARVQMHLFSLDAKKRWDEVETSLVEFQAKLERSGQTLGESATTSFEEITHAVKDLLRQFDGSAELTTSVRSLMRPAPRTCRPDDMLNQAAQIMWDLDCGTVPVVSADGSVVGIVTDRDICMASYTRGQALWGMTVESAMSKGVYVCAPEDSIGHALRVMAHRQIRRLPVVENGKLVGLLTLADIARDTRKHEGNRLRACVSLAHALTSISEHRAPTNEHAQAAAE